MLLSQPLRLTCKVAADQPAFKPPASAEFGDGRPVVRIRIAEPQQHAGWCLDAQRSVKADQRDCTSTCVSAHRPGPGLAGEWQLERGSADFQFLIRCVSNHFSQTSGWLLDVAEDAQRCHNVIVRKGDDNIPAAEWMIEPQGGFDVSSGVSPTYRLRLAVGPSEAVGWFLNVDSKPGNRRTADSMYLHVSPSSFATFILEVQKASGPRSLTLRQERFYEVVVCNLSGRPLILQGCKDVATRTRLAIAGSFLQLVPMVAAMEGAEDHGAALVERVLLQNPVSHPSPTVQAKFQYSGSCGDLLEFSVTYLTVEGSGVTIRVNAHAASTMQSSIQVHGQDLEVTSVMQNVPRLRVQPPRSYAETSLGVESGPGRGSRSAMFTLRLHDEVMAGMGPRQGRWLKITHPVEGWVQAATRDGQDILKEVVGCRPNLRQVVTVRPASKRQTSVQAAPAAQDMGSFREDEHTENAQSRARAVEACRLLREVARLEAFGPSGTPRKSTRGVF